MGHKVHWEGDETDVSNLPLGPGYWHSRAIMARAGLLKKQVRSTEEDKQETGPTNDN